MLIDDIERLDDDQYKAVLDFFARKAYGCGSYVVMTDSTISHDEHGQFVGVVIGGHITFWLMAYKNSVRERHAQDMFDVYSSDYKVIRSTSSSWKEVLRHMAILTSSKDGGSFISYLPDVPAMIDESSSICEALVSFDLDSEGLRRHE